MFINDANNFHQNSSEGEKQPLLSNQAYYGSIYNKGITGIVQFKKLDNLDSLSITKGLAINDQFRNQSYFCINAPNQPIYQENQKNREGFQENPI